MYINASFEILTLLLQKYDITIINKTIEAIKTYQPTSNFLHNIDFVYN